MRLLHRSDIIKEVLPGRACRFITVLLSQLSVGGETDATVRRGGCFNDKKHGRKHMLVHNVLFVC